MRRSALSGRRRPRKIGRLFGVLAAGLIPLLGLPAQAQQIGCPEALEAAALRYGVPTDLMLAVGRVESGLSPFAVNAAGISHFAADSASAIAFVESQRSAGIQSIDVGCGQVNLAWHPDAFTDLETAFDPEENAAYAAAFLSSLHERTGNWRQAAARYHSATPTLQTAYLARIDRALQSIAGGELPAYFASIAPAAGPLPAVHDAVTDSGGLLIRITGAAPDVRVFSATPTVRTGGDASRSPAPSGAVPRVIRVGD